MHLDIEGIVFPSLDELNTAIHISLHDFNERLMAGRKMSRKDMFLQGERDFLRPLPEKPFVIKERKLMTVGKNCYVTLFKHHYSVPREHVGKRVVILYDADTVEIYCGLNLVATHDRCDIPYTYSWKKEHNLPGHYGPYDKDLEELFKRAAEMDNIVLDYLREVDAMMQYPPKSFSSCRGILSLEKKYGTDRLVAACACASMKAAYGYQTVREILEQGEDADFLPDECVEHIAAQRIANLRVQKPENAPFLPSENRFLRPSRACVFVSAKLAVLTKMCKRPIRDHYRFV